MRIGWQGSGWGDRTGKTYKLTPERPVGVSQEKSVRVGERTFLVKDIYNGENFSFVFEHWDLKLEDLTVL